MSLTSQEVKRYENPLLKGIKEIEINNEKITINNMNASKYFKNIIYCCVIDKTKNNDHYVKLLLNEKEYNSVIDNFVIFRINNNNIITNPYFSSIMKVVSKKDISVFNKLDIPLDDFNLVINFTNIDYNNINSFIKTFEQKLSIEEFINNIYLADYYKIDNTRFINKLEEMLQKLDGYHNKIVVNKKIKSRKTQFYHGHININSMNYIKNDNSKYHEQIILLIKHFNRNKPDCLVLLLTYFLSNKFYISCLLKSQYILDYIIPKMYKNIAFEKSLRKAFKILYNIELALDTNIKQDDEIVFDINTVCKMPKYGITYMSPYNISDIEDGKGNYILGLTEKKNSRIIFNNRIANMEEFKKQMNVFITGNVKQNIFEDIDLSKYNASVVGSIIPACSIINHPLMYNFINLNEKFDTYNYYNYLHRFYAEYYSEADIDIMLYNTNMFTYIDSANNFINKLILECAKIQSNTNNLHFYKIKKKLSVRVMLTKNMINEKFKNIDISNIRKYKSLSPNIISKLSNTDKKQATEIYNIINKIFIDKYPSIYKNKYNKLSDSEKKKFETHNRIEFQDIKDIMRDDNIDIEFHIRTFSEFSICWSWKYSIESPFLLHNFEIFNSREKEPFSLVSKFHLNCVKGYYTKDTKDNVYLLPSCVIALQTFHNNSMSYFHGKSNKYEIINKYRMRGFGTNLNKVDMNKIKKFITESKFWKNLYPKLNINSKLHLGNELFMPRLRNMDYYNNSKYIIDIENMYNETNMNIFSKY